MLKTTCPLQAENTFRSQGFVWIKNGLVMNDNNKKQLKKTGRPQRRPKTIRYTISFNERKTPNFFLFENQVCR
jgi:hypothetical protein